MRKLKRERDEARQALAAVCALFPADMDDDGSGGMGFLPASRDVVKNARRVLGKEKQNERQ